MQPAAGKSNDQDVSKGLTEHTCNEKIPINFTVAGSFLVV